MLLTIDVGNTNVVLGLHDGEQLVDSWRFATEGRRTRDEWGILMTNLLTLHGYDSGRIEGAIVGSVVPAVTSALREAVPTYMGCPIMVIEPGIRTGLRILTDNPREVGADRIVNTLAAHRRYGGPAIVIDFGTATTFDVVSPGGDYLGGAIAPGIVISSESLYEHTALLTRVELCAPKYAIGKNTASCLQSGIVLGYVSMVEGLVDRIKAEMATMLGKPDAPLGAIKVIATGGLGNVIAAATTVIERYDPDLTLEGLRLIYEMNQQ